MVRVTGKTITMTRGDSAHIEIQMEYEGGASYEALRGDVIRFTVKKNYGDVTPLIVIDMEPYVPDGEETELVESVELHILPSHTRDLEYGSYRFDIQLLRVNGDIDTFIDKGTLTLTEEVGRYTDRVGGL